MQPGNSFTDVKGDCRRPEINMPFVCRGRQTRRLIDTMFEDSWALEASVGQSALLRCQKDPLWRHGLQDEWFCQVENRRIELTACQGRAHPECPLKTTTEELSHIVSPRQGSQANRRQERGGRTPVVVICAMCISRVQSFVLRSYHKICRC